MFQNPEIALDDLPDMEDLEWQQMHPRYVRRMLVERILIALAALVASSLPYLLLGGLFKPIVPIWALVIVFALPFLSWPLISVPRRGYVVRDRDIVFKSGVMWRSVTAIPYNRVQHVETSSTPFDRKFGIANLQVFTAGGSGGDLQISGLGSDTAEQLRVYILGKVGASIEDH
jgi:membrane protein YdbS with pleckstrin-like domain